MATVAYIVAAALSGCLVLVTVLRPQLYAERLFKPVYLGSLLGAMLAGAGAFAGLLGPSPGHALIAVCAVAVTCLPLSGKLEGRW